MPFKIPLQSEVAAYMEEKKGWPKAFCNMYAEKFWNFYQSNGWKVSGRAAMKDWKACFNSQWQGLKYKEDVELLNRLTGKNDANNPMIKPINGNAEVAPLDLLLEKYKNRGDIKFQEFGSWYDLMKKNRLLLQMDQTAIDELLSIYEGDKFKCRCACVMKTLDMYVISGMKFAEIIELRKRLQ